MKVLHEKSATPLRPGRVKGALHWWQRRSEDLDMSELLGLETTKAEGVQAGKGAGVIECLLAHRALDQLVDYEKR